MQLSMRRPLLALSLALCCVTLAGASPTSSQAQPAAPTLERLLAGFASMTGMSARFVEEKQIALLARPIRSEGVLYFTAPGRLMRRVTSPTVAAALKRRTSAKPPADPADLDCRETPRSAREPQPAHCDGHTIPEFRKTHPTEN